MYYNDTMTPPPPKIHFPVAEHKPPSTPTSYGPTAHLQSPNISIHLTPTFMVNITFTHHPHVEPQSLETPSTINITIQTPPPVRTVESQSPIPPPLLPNVHEANTKTSAHTVEIPPPHQHISNLSATAPLLNLNILPLKFLLPDALVVHIKSATQIQSK